MVEITVTSKRTKFIGYVFTATVSRPVNKFGRIGQGTDIPSAIADLTAKLKARGVNLDNVPYGVVVKH